LGVNEIESMGIALDLARSYRPSPNPRVGAVVVLDGQIVGQGAHRQAGQEHAEIAALAQAGNRAQGATMVVTLEPCAHTGRTGPCVDAIKAAGISTVIYAMADPNPQAAGGGAQLQAAGIDVIGNVLADEARALNRSWLHSLETGLPWVTWKVASTLDGRTAAADGTSKWITSPAARSDVQRLRAEVDAVLTGTGTALADNPRLDVREIPVERQPLRVVMGEREIPASFHLDQNDVVKLNHRDPKLALTELNDRGVLSLLLECGPTLAASFMEAGLIDEVVAYLAPALAGDGLPMIAPFGISTIGDLRRLEVSDVSQIGTDVRITALVKGSH
jgi:diaminohydroxyphosphoribosylaminopyrimidine deaminase / 5-amino-6-(5-phosphoribosylamino)uracil reductase